MEPWLFVRLLVTTRAWNDDVVGKRRIPLPYVDPGELGKLEGMLCCITDNAVGELHHDHSSTPPKNCGKFIFERGEGELLYVRCVNLLANGYLSSEFKVWVHVLRQVFLAPSLHPKRRCHSLLRRSHHEVLPVLWRNILPKPFVC